MRPDPAQPAVVVNPEAGHHEITADPDLLAACERAIDATYAHPYYSERYGERGRSFSSSDSGWLVLVAGEGHTRATQQVSWLGRALAARGMPLVLLEEHLGLLSEEVRSVQGWTTHADELSTQASLLRTARLAAIDEAAWSQVENAFEAATQGEKRGLPRASALLVSAVADEANALSNVVSSLTGWLLDPERFSLTWIAAGEAALDEARAAVRTESGA